MVSRPSIFDRLVNEPRPRSASARVFDSITVDPSRIALLESQWATPLGTSEEGSPDALARCDFSFDDRIQSAQGRPVPVARIATSGPPALEHLSRAIQLLEKFLPLLAHTPSLVPPGARHQLVLQVPPGVLAGVSQ